MVGLVPTGLCRHFFCNRDGGGTDGDDEQAETYCGKGKGLSAAGRRGQKNRRAQQEGASNRQTPLPPAIRISTFSLFAGCGGA